MFWLWKIARTNRSEAYVAHMDGSFGAGHLGQTVLPSTVSTLTFLKLKFS